MSIDPPLDLEELPSLLWAELVRASRDRHHGWRLPVLATVDAQGAPQARTVVLRDADPASGELLCCTDLRSPKVAQLRADGRGVLVFWCTRLSWQLRAQVHIAVEADGPRVRAAWSRVAGQPAARDYRSLLPPGTTAPGEAEATHFAPDGVQAPEPGAAARGAAAQPHHLAVLAARVRALDWLDLHRHRGPRRAAVDAHGRARWLVP